MASKQVFIKEQLDVLKTYLSIGKKLGQFPSFLDLESVGITRAMVRSRFGSLNGLVKVIQKQYPDDYDKFSINEEKSKLRNQLMAKHAELISQYSRFLTPMELREEDVSYERIFGSVSAFIDETRKSYPEVFDNLLTDAVFTPERFNSLKQTISKYDKFVITTVVAGCTVDKKSLETIKSYCEKNDALLLLLPVADPASNRSRMCNNLMFDKILVDENFVYKNLPLSSNFAISGIQLQAKQINPFTGLHRIGRKIGTMVYGSPKQSLEPIAGEEFPRFVMSPGAITFPDYDTSLYVSNRTAYLAQHDHIMGAIVVEIVDSKKYFFRQLQFGKDGDFIDLGVRYKGNKVEEVQPEAFIMGDLQFPAYDPKVMRCWRKLCKDIPPKYLFVHDARDALPEAIFDRKKNIEMAIKNEEFTLSVEKDLASFVRFMNDLTELPEEKVLVVKSNHDEMLDRWLQSGEYVKDPCNFEIGHVLAVESFRGLKKDKYFDILEMASKMMGISDKVKFLKRNDRFIISDVECARHGDLGSCGRYSPPLSDLEKTYRNAVIGHRHSPQIMRGIWVVGTSGLKDPRYRRGPTQWLSTSCHVYSDGRRQLITCIDGEYKLG